MCERGVQLRNPFFSIWISHVGTNIAVTQLHWTTQPKTVAKMLFSHRCSSLDWPPSQRAATSCSFVIWSAEYSETSASNACRCPQCPQLVASITRALSIVSSSWCWPHCCAPHWQWSVSLWDKWLKASGSGTTTLTLRLPRPFLLEFTACGTCTFLRWSYCMRPVTNSGPPRAVTVIGILRISLSNF